MKTAVVYFSLGGATRSFARAEANARARTCSKPCRRKNTTRFPRLSAAATPPCARRSVPLSGSARPDRLRAHRPMAPVWGGFPRRHSTASPACSRAARRWRHCSFPRQRKQ